MQINLAVYDNQNLKEKIENPTLADIQKVITEVSLDTTRNIELVYSTNRMFFETSQSRWLIRYTGKVDNYFVNAILNDLTQSKLIEVVFDGLQRVEYLLTETVSEEIALKVAISFIDEGILFTTKTIIWDYVDKLPLET